MRKKIIILYPNSFPIGGAATNRVIHICKALNQEGNILKIYITRPTEKRNNVQTKRKGIHEGIEFYYVNKSIIWPEKLINKVRCKFFGIINTSIILAKENYDIVLSYADYSFFNHLIYFLFVKARRKKIVYAVDEYPWSVIHKTNSIFNKLYLRLFYKLFDALIVITLTLMEYYSTKIRKGTIMHHMPMTIETEEFNKFVNNRNDGSSYIAYCGYDIKNVGGDIMSRDGVDILIDAFAIISRKHKNIFLYIIGKSNEYRYQQVERLNLQEKVVFTGNIPRNELLKYLCNAILLVLAKPDNIAAQGSFPSKLGEYLATGNPVVVTKVGEIPLYLKDDYNAFLAEPGDKHSLAERMDYALSNPDIAKRIGLKGRELAVNEFDYKKQGTKLREFLSKI